MVKMSLGGAWKAMERGFHFMFGIQAIPGDQNSWVSMDVHPRNQLLGIHQISSTP